MTHTHRWPLFYDTLLANGIPRDAVFLQWKVAKVHIDCYTLGPEWNEARDGDAVPDDYRTGQEYDWPRKVDQNHWVIIVETEDARQIRLEMVDMWNPRTVESRPGVLMLHRLAYKGPSKSMLYRATYTWSGPPATIRQFLEHTLKKGWHKYEMVETDEGVKGCRYHLSTILSNLAQSGFLNEESDRGSHIDKAMMWRYTKNNDMAPPALLTTHAGPYKQGKFW